MKTQSELGLEFWILCRGYILSSTSCSRPVVHGGHNKRGTKKKETDLVRVELTSQEHKAAVSNGGGGKKERNRESEGENGEN